MIFPNAILIHTSIWRHDYREKATFRFFAKHQVALDGMFENVWHAQPGGDDRAYSRILRQAWTGGRTVVNFERDMVPSGPEVLRDLLLCSEPLCAVDYPLVRCTAVHVKLSDGGVGELRDHKFPGPVGPEAIVCVLHMVEQSMIRRIDDHGEERWYPFPYPGTHGTGFPLGLTKFDRRAIAAVPTWDDPSWWLLDTTLSDLFLKAGIMAHVHHDPGLVHRRPTHHRHDPFGHGLPLSEHRKFPGLPVVPLSAIRSDYRNRLLTAPLDHRKFVEVVL